MATPTLFKVLDPRSPLGRMRRGHIYTFASAMGQPFTAGEPAEDVRQRLQKAGFSGTELLDRLRGDEVFDFARRVGFEFPREESTASLLARMKEYGYSGLEVAQKVGWAAPEDPKVLAKEMQQAEKARAEVEAKPFETMSMPDLRKACKAMGLKQSPRDKATDLVERLKAAAAPETAAA